ncbi:acyl-CoA dehydrogenase family protein [Rhizorhabdus histidinilytica]
MNFDFSEDQEHLRNEARRFLEARCGIGVVRGVLDDGARSHDADLWAALVEQGWTALTLPEEHGGLGMGRTDLCVLAEELGRVLAPVPFASTVYLLAEALMMAGTAAQRERLKDIAAGRCIGCIAIAEGPGEPSPPASPPRFAAGGCMASSCPSSTATPRRWRWSLPATAARCGSISQISPILQ